MPAGILTQTADAVVGLLTATVAAAEGTIERSYDPEEELPNLVVLKVTVVPRLESRDRASRKQWYQDYTVDVAVQKRVETVEDIDNLTAFVETLANILADNDFPSPAVQLLSIKVAGPYPPHLGEKKTFTGVITAVYRGGRMAG